MRQTIAVLVLLLIGTGRTGEPDAVGKPQTDRSQRP